MYDKEEFKETALKRGYACSAVIGMWLEDHPKTFYSEDDLIECYRFQERKNAREDRDSPGRKEWRMTEDERKQAKRDTWL